MEFLRAPLSRAGVLRTVLRLAAGGGAPKSYDTAVVFTLNFS